MGLRGATRSWIGVALVGVAVLGLVVGLRLFPRMNSGQDVVDALDPVFERERIAADHASLAMMARIIDIGYPTLRPAGKAAAEVEPMVRAVAEQLDLRPGQVKAKLAADYPHLDALLRALPFSEVLVELPELVEFLAGALETSPAEVQAALETNFPRLSQALDRLAIIVPGRDFIPNTEGMVNFAGNQVRDTPQMRDYLTDDVLPMMDEHRRDFERLEWFPPVRSVPYILTLIGLLLLGLGATMAWRSHRGQLSPRLALRGWVATTTIGATVLVAVFGFQLYPRLNGGSDLVDAARPAFSEVQITGTRAGVDMANSIIEALDPIATPRGGATEEVPALVGFVSEQTGLTPRQVLATLGEQFPHTAALLQAIPLTVVTSEFNDLVGFVSEATGSEPEALVAGLQASFPNLMRAALAVAEVSATWYAVPGLEQLTRFDGTPVRSAVEMGVYLDEDLVVPVEAAAPEFRHLDSISPDLNVFPPLLAGLGLFVVGYGVAHLVWERRRFAPSDRTG